MHKKKQTAGYSLVEVLVAIAILLLALVGPMTIAAKGIQSAGYVREQTTALFLAQEGIEAFTAARNDAVITSFASGDLSTSWDWASDGTIPVSCFNNGCNFAYTDNTPLSDVTACNADGSGCELYFDDTDSSDRARYTLDGSNALTKYKRVVKVTSVSSGGGLQIESVVYWDANLFGSSEQNVVLTTSLFSLYE